MIMKSAKILNKSIVKLEFPNSETIDSLGV